MGHLYYTELENTAWYFGCDLGINCGLVNTGPFENLSDEFYWYGMEYAPNPNYVWHFGFDGGPQWDFDKEGHDRAWAVRVVPEPVRSILFVVGGATLGFRRYWKKRRTA
jgi:hypothetical protein